MADIQGVNGIAKAVRLAHLTTDDRFQRTDSGGRKKNVDRLSANWQDAFMKCPVVVPTENSGMYLVQDGQCEVLALKRKFPSGKNTKGKPRPRSQCVAGQRRNHTLLQSARPGWHNQRPSLVPETVGNSEGHAGWFRDPGGGLG